jgi:predicted phosphodiesterase
MKIAAISDIHGNLPALQAVLDDIADVGADIIFNCGDTLGGPLESAKTADLLMAREIPMIAGNHERQLLTLPPERLNRSDACTASEINAGHRTWLASAPPTVWLADDVFVCHGTPSSDIEYWLETITSDFGVNGSPGVRAATEAEAAARLGEGAHAERASLILCGHTHVPRVMTVRPTNGNRPASESITVVNAGSVGLPGYDDDRPFRHAIETGSPHARYALVCRVKQGWQVQLRSVPYDFEQMATLAERRGRPDWAHPLRTGRVLPTGVKGA